MQVENERNHSDVVVNMHDCEYTCAQCKVLLKEIENLRSRLEKSEAKLRESETMSKERDAKSKEKEDERIKELEEELEKQRLETENRELIHQLEREEVMKRKLENEKLRLDMLMRPDVTRVAGIVKALKQKGMMLTDKSAWAKLSKELIVVGKRERWPNYLLDLDDKELTWVPEHDSTEFDRMKRVECAMVISDIVDEKHRSKLLAVSESEHPHNAQMMFRRLNDFFAMGKEGGDTIKAGIDLRTCTMGSTGLTIADFGLKLEEKIEVCSQMGITVDVLKEAIPLYLNGLTTSFSQIVNDIHNKLLTELEWKPTLRDVMTIVEKRAVTARLLSVKASGKITQQNVQDHNKQTKKKNSKKTKKDLLDQNAALAKKLREYEGKQETGGGTISQGSQQTAGGPCKHQEKCWIKNCPYKHASGHVPARNPFTNPCTKCNKKGHTEEECGKCYACKSEKHLYKDCPKRATRAEGQKSPYQGIARIEEHGHDEDDRGVLLHL